jgi:hypothetical protein
MVRVSATRLSLQLIAHAIGPSLDGDDLAIGRDGRRCDDYAAFLL